MTLITAFAALLLFYSSVSARLERTVVTAPMFFTAAGMVGWFGPRGLASIVLGVVYLERAPHLAGTDTIRLAVMLTVLASIFAHGLSAIPGIRLYARELALLNAAAPEREAADAQSAAGELPRIVRSP
jgi:NhaP-type Na+/H+ or K+/H+ antiporter